MNPIRRAWEWLYPPATKLRNKPGGLALIRMWNVLDGSETLSGRIVKTVSLDSAGLWNIDPAQSYVVKNGNWFYHFSNVTVGSGANVTVTAMGDEYLEPLPEIGEDARDESAAWLPPVPTYEPSKKSTPQTAEIASSDRAVLSAVLLSARAKKGEGT